MTWKANGTQAMAVLLIAVLLGILAGALAAKRLHVPPRGKRILSFVLQRLK